MAAQEVPFGANEQFGVAELLQVLSLRGRTGKLLLRGGAAQAELHFAQGRLIWGDLLPPTATVDLAAFAAEARQQAIHNDIQRALVEVLSWPAGQAVFDEAAPAPPFSAPHEVDRLLIESVRMLDEWQEVGQALPSAGECLTWATTPPVDNGPALGELARHILRQCNGRTTLGDIARKLHASDLQVATAARSLLERGYVQRPSAQADGATAKIDADLEALLTRCLVELQVQVAALAQGRHRERRVQSLVGVLVSAADTLAGALQGPSAIEGNLSAAWLAETLPTLQGRYTALDLIALAPSGLDCGDLVAAYGALSGSARDAFYVEALDGLYDFLVRMAVRVVEDHISGRHVAERLRAAFAALLLELETAIRQMRPPAPLPGAGDTAALRQKHFHLVA